MNNYKIRVNNEAESREAQELFFELGYGFFSAKNKAVEAFEYTGEFYFFAYSSDLDLTVSKDRNLFFAKYDFQELTLPQLRALVVLHRNVVMDATHVGKSGSEYYVTDAEEVYFFDGMEWVSKDVDVSNLKPIQKPQLEQGLISGADALRALADGEDVQGTLDLKLWVNARGYGLDEFLDPNTSFKFRLKPRTVKLEIEVPAPFEPEFDERFFFIDSNYPDGFNFSFWQGRLEEKCRSQFGVYRTEAEIKIVVEQLRKIKEHSK